MYNIGNKMPELPELIEIKPCFSPLKAVIPAIEATRFTNLDPNKLRGGYYTPETLTRWLSMWAIRNCNDRIIEPSCGDGAFIIAAAQRLLLLGAKPNAIGKQLLGIEIIREEAQKTSNKLSSIIGNSGKNTIENNDFFAWFMNKASTDCFDCVIGNPPFIRYQSFPEQFRNYAMQLMSQYGLKPNRLTNIWVPFVVVAAHSLYPDGRMALILPAELLQVTYAGQLRSFLTNHFKRIDIIACNHLFFDNAQQEVVLLLADGFRKNPSNINDCKVTLTETDSVQEVVSTSPSTLLQNAEPKTLDHANEKWLKYFLSSQEIGLMRELKKSSEITSLKFHAEVDVGIVTGKNEFFVLDVIRCKELGIKEEYLIPLVGRSAHLHGALLQKRDWKNLALDGQRVYLLHLQPHADKKLTLKLKAYIESGEALGFNNGYKCSIRKPWYNVPSVWTPHGFIFRQIYDFPRAILNKAGATSTDTIHRLTCKSKSQAVITSLYTSLTAASAEIEGRSYGGGVLELEPTEAERLLMPCKIGTGLSLEEIDSLIRSNKLEHLLNENDRIILQKNIGLTANECKTLRAIWVKMRERRQYRGQNARS